MAEIPSTPADGKIKTVLVPTVANLAAPTLAVANAVGAIDISCYLTPGGFALSVDQATITDERECDTIVRGAPGRKTPALTITGIDNTNSAVSDNDLAESLEEGSTWVAIRRRGKAFEADFATGDIVTVTEFTVGVRSDVAAEANSVLRSVWSTFINGFEPDAVIAAS